MSIFDHIWPNAFDPKRKGYAEGGYVGGNIGNMTSPSDYVFYDRERDIVVTYVEMTYSEDNIRDELTTAQKFMALRWSWAISHITDIEEAIWT
jgi:hypothetical protein